MVIVHEIDIIKGKEAVIWRITFLGMVTILGIVTILEMVAVLRIFTILRDGYLILGP